MKNLTLLPLSWNISNINNSKFTEINCLLNNKKWLAFGEFNQDLQIGKILSDKLKHGNYLIRGCNEGTAQTLSHYGYEKILIGQEALLDLEKDHFGKKSLQKLVKRGSRHGRVEELDIICSEKVFRDFLKNTSHSKEPQLKNLFHSDAAENFRLFAFIKNDENTWLGALVISKSNAFKYHTELLLRRNDAPVGIMESIIEKVFKTLKSENVSEFSLGEVPFKKNNKFSLSLEHFVNLIGLKFNFVYNSKGLYNFKDKFNPAWNNIYICSKNRVSFLDLLTIFIKSNYYKLLLNRLFPAFLTGNN